MTATRLRVAKPPPNAPPDLRIGTDIERMTDEAIMHLAERDSRNYQQSGRLVQVILYANTSGDRDAVARAAGTPVIKELSMATLRERLSSCSRWIRKSDDGWIGSVPPDIAVAAVASRGYWPGIPPLEGVVQAPTLRGDGSVLQTPGYDKLTSLLFMPNATFAEVSESPSQDDAKNACAVLRDVVCDFPFAEESHASAWIAGVLTLMSRHAISGPVPLFAVDATTRGSGKSRLADAAARIAYGHDAIRSPQRANDEEFAKNVMSVLLGGDAMVLIDNVLLPLGGGTLDALLTSRTWKDRILGSNERVTVSHNTCWWANGNNLVLAGDLARRCLMIRIESSLENPEDRTVFKHNPLLDWCTANRKILVGAALTILRAYCVANRPDVGVRMASFESWAALVPSAIVWAGSPNPMLARATTDDANDGDKINQRAVLAGVEAIDPSGSGVTAKTVIDMMYPHNYGDGPRQPDASPAYEPLRAAIESITRTQSGRTPDATRLGKYFAKIRGRVCGGLKLERGAVKHNAQTWRVVKCTETNPVAES